jgi:hypothetical protein
VGGSQLRVISCGTQQKQSGRSRGLKKLLA